MLKDGLPDAVLNDLSHANDSLYLLAESLDRYLSTCLKKPQSLANLRSHLGRFPINEGKGGEVRIIFGRYLLSILLDGLLLSFPLPLLCLSRSSLLSNEINSLVRFSLLLFTLDLRMRTIIILRPAVAGIEDLLVLSLEVGVHRSLVLRSWRRPS